jgi:glycerophosphoryl diester phosphodiesterase
MAAETVFRRRDGGPPLIFGHRGVRGAAPENTMAAFELAAASGADGIELDVRLCRSGEVVVVHDPTLARYTGGKEPRAVADLDLAELSRVDVGGGQTVPLLGDVLAWAAGKRLAVNVEIKRDVPDRRRLVRETARAMRPFASTTPGVMASSFDPWMLAHFGWLLPDVLRGSLFSSDSQLERLQRSGWVARAIGARAVHPERTLVVPERCRRWKKHGSLINVWTVNDVAEAESLSAMGVDAIISDVPAEMVRALR